MHSYFLYLVQTELLMLGMMHQLNLVQVRIVARLALDVDESCLTEQHLAQQVSEFISATARQADTPAWVKWKPSSAPGALVNSVTLGIKQE